jgi:hypothetical protein
MRSFVGLIGVVIALFSSLLMATSLVEISGLLTPQAKAAATDVTSA